MRRTVCFAVTATAAAVTLALANPATASGGTAALSATGHTIRSVASASVNARSSGNWFGYVQGTLEKAGHPTFHQVAGTWVVPTASQHTSGEAEASSTWIGIGGGCVNLNCLVVDQTLIQAGTEQNVDSNGVATYWTWMELIPGPSIRTPLAVSPGDKIRGSITALKASMWRIKLVNETTGRAWSKVVPYTSSRLSAEWVNETPLTAGGFAALPNLTPTHFDDTLVNGHNPNLAAVEKISLTDGQGHPIGVASDPQGDRDGFGICAWASSCPVPGEF